MVIDNVPSNSADDFYGRIFHVQQDLSVVDVPYRNDLADFGYEVGRFTPVAIFIRTITNLAGAQDYTIYAYDNSSPVNAYNMGSITIAANIAVGQIYWPSQFSIPDVELCSLFNVSSGVSLRTGTVDFYYRAVI